ICPQPDWHNLIPEISDHSTTDTSFWVSSYRKGYTSIHGSVKVDRVPGAHKVDIKGQDGIDVEYINSRTLKVSCTQIGAKDITVYAPRKEWKASLSKPILAIDVSSDNRLYAYTQEQHIIVASVQQEGETQMIMKGHLSDVTTIRFFPSNQVLLSGGSDFQAKIWSVQDGSNPVTLTGHTAGITDLAIVSVGRNVLSMYKNFAIHECLNHTSSRDGTVRLWHCGSGTTLSVLGNYQVPVTKMILITLPSSYKPGDPTQLDEREVETNDKVILVGLNDGTVRGIHLGTKEEIFSVETNATKVSALQYDPDTEIILVGGENGVVQVYQLSNLKKPRLEWQRSDHAVTGLVIQQTNNGELIPYVSTADGNVYSTSSIVYAIQEQSKLTLSAEYSGNELESISDITMMKTTNKQQLLCCNREGYIKIY
ncbi:hypothetical protein INT45_001859, partial [Circinella minor]